MRAPGPARLIRDDTGEVLVCDGLIASTYRAPGRLTAHRIVDRSTVADDVITGNVELNLELIVAPGTTILALAGEARLADVASWLERAREDRAFLTFIAPPDPTITGIVIPAFTRSRDVKGSRRYSFPLTQARVASGRVIYFDAPPAAAAQPAGADDDVAAGLEVEADAGTRAATEAAPPPTSLLAGLFNSFFGGS